MSFKRTLWKVLQDVHYRVRDASVRSCGDTRARVSSRSWAGPPSRQAPESEEKPSPELSVIQSLTPSSTEGKLPGEGRGGGRDEERCWTPPPACGLRRADRPGTGTRAGGGGGSGKGRV